jgi:transcription initiation factor TFIIB
MEKEKVESQKKCPECGSTKLVRDYERAELVCASCGYIIHDKIMDMGPEWRAFDQEQRERRGRVGAPMTLSVDYAEPVIIERDGQVQVVEIGKFVDEVIERSGARRMKNVEIAEVSGYRTVAFDKDLRIGFRPISHVVRHEVVEDLYEIELETGRKIRVTGAHSLFTVRKNEVCPIRVDSIKKGEFIVVPRYLPTLESPDRPNLLEKFASLPEEPKLEFMQAQVSGDGCICVMDEENPGWQPAGQIHTVSANGALGNDIMFLYPQQGALAGYREGKIPAHEIRSTGQFIGESRLTGTRVTDPDVAKDLGFIEGVAEHRRKAAIEDTVPAPQEYKKFWGSRARKRISRELAISIAKKVGDEKLLALAESPLAFLRARKITKVKPTSRYAYDLSVPGCENFVAGLGGVFAHNTIHDKGLSTMIDWRDRDSHGKDLTPKRRAQIYRLRKWQRRIRVSDATERNLAFALSEIDRMASHLNLPRNVREAAALIYRKAVEERLIRGRSIEGVAAAALYAACRESKVPRTLDEIAEVSRVSKKEIGRSYRFIARELLIHLRPTSPIDYIPRFGSDLGLSGAVQSKAIELLKEATKKGLTSGRGPTGVAAAAIYIASVLCGERRTQRDVADVARVTEVTVRNRYKELCEKLGLDVEL